MTRAFVSSLALLFAVAFASRGLISHLLVKKSIYTPSIHAQVATLLNFHENIAHGNWIPVWAAHFRFGYGEPNLQFTPPLQHYLTELFFLLVRNPTAAIQLTGIFLFLLSAVGMLRLVRRINPWPSTHAEVVAAFAYTLNPLLLCEIYRQGELSQALGLALVPYTLSAFIDLAQKPARKNLALAALSLALFAISRPSMLVAAFPFFCTAAWIWRRQIRARLRLVFAVLLGLGTSMFYWGAVLLEAKFLRSPLFLNYPKIVRPSEILALISFSGILFIVLLLNSTLKKTWHWVLAMICIAAVSFFETSSQSSLLRLPENYASETIPVGVINHPQTRAENTVEFIRGRGESRCERGGPTQISCEVLAIQNSILRFNQIDFPGWQTWVDGKVSRFGHPEPLSGLLLVDLVPGKHFVRWEFKNTWARNLTRSISVLAWLVLLGLLFQDQLAKAQALLPKRLHHLKRRAATQTIEL